MGNRWPAWASAALMGIDGGVVCVLGINQQHGGLRAIIGSVPLVFSGLSTGYSGYCLQPRLQPLK
jgi:hypothetical protein